VQDLASKVGYGMIWDVLLSLSLDTLAWAEEMLDGTFKRICLTSCEVEV